MSVARENAGEASFDEDLVLVDRVLGGDDQAFQVLYDRYYEKVFGIARGVLLDTEESLDAVQEIFTLVYKNLDRFDRRARFSTWLFRIAVNRSIQQARKLKHKSKNVPLNEAHEQAAEERPMVDHDDPRIAESLKKLAPNDRALLSLFYWEDLSLNEIAASLDCSVNAAKTRLFRARERFRKLYEEADET